MVEKYKIKLGKNKVIEILNGGDCFYLIYVNIYLVMNFVFLRELVEGLK